MDNQNEIVNLLWTGGWDSTYRLVELSRTNQVIQPIYVYGNGRKSEHYEIKAMEKILGMLKTKNETIAEILPIEYVHIDSIKFNEEISQAFYNIKNEIHLGMQYEWLPCLALEYPNLEIGIEKAPPQQSGAINAITNYGKMDYIEELDTHQLNIEKSTNDLSLLFKNLRFPIIDKDGNDMINNIKNWGYEDVMENVWMCFTPIFGEPCGTCNPCKSKMETGMEFLLTSNSIKRYKNRNNNLSKKKDDLLKFISRHLDKIRFS